MATTRREFLHAGASAAALGTEAFARGHDGPNIVLLVVDTLRADHVYGDRARTPNIDALARAGLRFTRCFPEAMPTVPARNSIMTGRRMFPFRGWYGRPGLVQAPGWAPFERVDTCFTSVLHRAGYWTACVTDNPFLGFPRGYGEFRGSFDRFVRKGGQAGAVAPLSSVSDRELRHWLHPAIAYPGARQRLRRYLANGGYWHDESRSWSARVYRAAAGLLDDARRRRPFALVVDTFEPHEPWTPPRRYLNMYGDPDYHGPEPSKPPYRRVGDYLDEGEAAFVLRRMRALYAAEVTMTDRWLGFFLERLHDLRLERDTVIVLVSDHGFQFGEHGWTGKIASELHPPLIRVPLILVDPSGRGAGRASSHFASTHDIAPTLLALAGVRAPRMMEGANLAPLLRGGRPRERRLAYGGYANNFYARTDRWALTASNGGEDFRLFDLRHDPYEHRNVAASHPGKVGELYGAVLRRAGGRLPLYGA
jgi:arylsulfatase A-like enzyme